MSQKKPVIGIIGGTITGNRGAESMLLSAIGRVKEMYPDALFKVYSYYPKQDRALVHHPQIDILSCKPAALVLRFFPFAAAEWLARKFGTRLPDSLLTNVIRSLRECDVLLDISGVSFVDGREKFLPFNILTILPAMMLGVPVVKLSQAMGSFHNPVNRLTAKMFLSRCAHVYARGAITETYLKEINIKNMTRAADVAFSYQVQDNLTVENEDLVEALEQKIIEYKKENKTVFAFCPSSLVYGQSPKYIDQLCALIKSLDGEPVRFLMLANSNRQISDKPRNNDLYVLRILQDYAKQTLLPETYQRIDWAIWDINTHSLRRLLIHCDLLLTSRFHAVISGLALSIPTLVIGWSHKYQEALADFGMDEYAVDFENANINLVDLVKKMLQNKEKIKTQLTEALEPVRASSRSQFEILKKIL
jgi:colanic acid/amylovoran biosynthesis protein